MRSCRLVLYQIMALTVTYAVARAEPLDTGPWLVDLGRDYPRSSSAGLSDADAEITLLLMEAAGRVAPDLAEAYRWQYDMLSALGRYDDARESLGKYVELAPGDAEAFLLWIDLETDRLQSAEERAGFYRTLLSRPTLPDQVASDLHRRVAEFHYNRGEREQATASAEAAVEAYPLNFAARELLDMLRPSPPSAGQVELAELRETLLALSAAPGQARIAVRAGELLVRLNLLEPADRMYAHAAGLLRLVGAPIELPLVLMERIALLRMLGRDDEARRLTTEASEAWRDLLARAREGLGPELTARMAWFYAWFEPDPQQAEKLARLALGEDAASVMARRALGAALRAAGRLDEAKNELAQVADVDVVAAAEYAEALMALGEEPLARQTLAAAATQPAGTTGTMLLRRASQRLENAPPASQPAPAEAMQVLNRFDWRVLDYPMNPSQYVALDLEMPRRELPPAEPWLLTARVRNVGPFPITVGEQMMVSPDLLVLVETTGDRQRLGAPIPLVLKTISEIPPGETVELIDSIDLGTIRSGMIGTPRMNQEVTVNAVLSPAEYVNEQGEHLWGPGIGGVAARPLRFVRSAFSVSGESMSAVMRNLRDGDIKDRIAAMELLAMLLAEHQHLAAGRLDYPVRPVDAAAVQAAVLSRVADADWQVRARLAETLRWFALDKQATEKAMALLSDPHWLVRGLTFRALADHYGAKFQNVLARAATADPDPWVRRLAAALSARITAAATQPTTTQPATTADE